MEHLSLNPLARRSKLIPLVRCSLSGVDSLMSAHDRPLQLRAPAPRDVRRPTRRMLATSSITSATVGGVQQVQEENETLQLYPKFSSRGEPVELPENVVPEAFREWGVQIFDWQTQCPTLAETAKPSLIYKLIKLLPTVGCEADAATRYTVEEKIVQGSDAKLAAFAYDQTGSYVAVWAIKEHTDGRSFEIEHCLVHPKNHEVRIRIIQSIKMEQMVLSIKKINLGGCAIRESGFASTVAMEESEVLGTWQSACVAATFTDLQTNAIRELAGERRQELVRGQEGLVTLPKKLWSSIGKKEDESWVEAGWLIDQGQAITSRCVFLKDGNLKEIAVGHEAEIPKDV
ncbi:unnamed protein product [Spirodela intermedia]|uniref:Uncharacterized protein n=1 Tax=Spirodela intermedia TaxID=51605 RepID=A0A7I8JA41_SPIIN|nr:unnamed protein product [Spirodela intermedia]CAA6666645.1 unnamed protein product [Spirodela intermedia]